MEKNKCCLEVTSMVDGKAVTESRPVVLRGVIAEPFAYEYSRGRRKFYRGIVSTMRDSGTEDLIHVVAEESMVDFDAKIIGKRIEVCGSIRTRNYYDETHNKRRLDVFVFASDMLIEDYVGVDRVIPETGNVEINEFDFEGYICKEPVFRTTPKGRHIADVLIAVNRNNVEVSDYLPCIFWGTKALEVSDMHVGDLIKCKARFQSREYQKAYEDGNAETRIAYEISVFDFENTGESNSKVEDESEAVNE